MIPSAFIAAVWIVWLVTWILAAGWSARTASHHDLGAESPSRVLTLGAVVMILASYFPMPNSQLWESPREIGWAMAGLVVLGLGFTWAARLHLGPLWSSTSAPSEDHRIVDTGPYGVVRHPVYAGLLLAVAPQPWRADAWRQSEAHCFWSPPFHRARSSKSDFCAAILATTPTPAIAAACRC